LPFHAELFKAPAIFQSVSAAQMQLLKIEAILRTLRFDDSLVLPEDAPGALVSSVFTSR
jgi:hypothetical protein